MGLDAKEQLVISLGLGAFSFNMIPLVFFFAIELFNIKATVEVPQLLRRAMFQVLGSLTALVGVTVLHVAVVLIASMFGAAILNQTWMQWVGVIAIACQMVCIGLCLFRCWTLYRRLDMLGR